MFDPFEGMARLGFTRLPEPETLFGIDKKEPKAPEEPKEGEKTNPENFVFLKNRTCPACGSSFHDAALRVTKCKFVGGDTDLRPRFVPYDPLLYEAVVCYHCGYAALHSVFDQLTEKQAGLIKIAVTPQYKYKEYPLVYKPSDAIERYKLALLCAYAKKAKNSEKAWLCLKLAWLCRETKDEDAERGYLRLAVEGFESAFASESFPLYGMDDTTLLYLLGELCRRIGRRDEAMRYISRVLVAQNATDKLRERARNVKGLLSSGQ